MYIPACRRPPCPDFGVGFLGKKGLIDCWRVLIVLVIYFRYGTRGLGYIPEIARGWSNAWWDGGKVWI